MKLRLVSFQRLLAPADQIVHALSADARALGDLAQGKVFQDELLLDVFLMLCEKLSVKII